MTAVLALAGFISTSCFRVWQIKTHNKDITTGIAAILMSYLPAYVYYSYWKQQQDVFIRKISLKYASAIPDTELSLFKDK